MSDELREAAEFIDTAFVLGMGEDDPADAQQIAVRYKFIREAKKLARHFLAQADLDKLQDYTSPPLKRVGTITGKFTPAEPEGGREC